MASLEEFQRAVGETVTKCGYNGPVFVICFPNMDSVKFQVVFLGNASEGQFQVAGEELSAVGAMLRKARLDNTVKLAPVPQTNPVRN